MVWDLAWKLDKILRLSPSTILAWIFFMQIFLFEIHFKPFSATYGDNTFFYLYSFFILFRGKFVRKFHLFTHDASDRNMQV